LTTFDNWFEYYHQAKIFYSIGNFKKSQIMVKNSILKLQPNSFTSDKVLFFKYMLYSARVEARIGDKQKALNAFTNVSHFLGKMSFFTLSLDNAILNQEMASLYNQLGDHSKAMDAVSKSLQIMSKMMASSNSNLILELKSHPELQSFALFEKIIAGIHLLKDKGAGEDEELREDQVKAIKEDWAKIEAFYFSIIERNKLLKKEKILQLVNLMNLFKDKVKDEDASLDLALKILNYVRDEGMEDELLAVYIAIADIYDRKGLKAKSEVYIKLLQESGVTVERDEGKKSTPSDTSPQPQNEGAIRSDEQN
jgi:tetratricopeptide (TPR) repeat protein